MNRVKFIKHKGKEILYVDYSNLKPAEVVSLIEESNELIKDQPKNSVLQLIVVTEMSFNEEVKEKLKKVAAEKAPYVEKVQL